MPSIIKVLQTLTGGLAQNIQRPFKRLKRSDLQVAKIDPFRQRISFQRSFEEALSRGDENQFAKDCDRDCKVLSYKGTYTLYQQYKKEFDELYEKVDDSDHSERETELKDQIEKDFRVFLKDKLGDNQEKLTQEILYWFSQSVFNSSFAKVCMLAKDVYGGMLIPDQGTESDRHARLQIPTNGPQAPVSVKSDMAIAYSKFISNETGEVKQLPRPIQCNFVATHKILGNKVEASVKGDFSPVPSLDHLDVQFEQAIPFLKNADGTKVKAFLNDTLNAYMLKEYGVSFKDPMIEKEDVDVTTRISDPSDTQIEVEQVYHYNTFEFRGLTHKMKTQIQCKMTALYDTVEELGVENKRMATFSIKTTNEFTKKLPEDTLSDQVFPLMSQALQEHMDKHYGIELGAPTEEIEEAPKQHPVYENRTVLEKVAIYTQDLPQPLHVKMYAETENGNVQGPVKFSVIAI